MESRSHSVHGLPSSLQLIERLISQLSDCSSDPHELPDHHQTPSTAFQTPHLASVKSLLLTLHCIFPNELLLALDILDRGLASRFVRDEHEPSSTTTATATATPTTNPDNNEALDPTEDSKKDTFFVISASAAPPIASAAASRPHLTRAEQKGYEVRLQAWNCTCPTFTLAAFSHPTPTISDDDLDSSPYETTPQYSFGGSLTRGPTRSSPPVCKHLLACLLMMRCPGLFGTTVREGDCVRVSADELAGWCAGWGG